MALDTPGPLTSCHKPPTPRPRPGQVPGHAPGRLLSVQVVRRTEARAIPRAGIAFVNAEDRVEKGSLVF